jgi:small subunit ribosomal protein S6
MERAMRLSEDVIRYLTIKQDGPMPAPRALPSTTSEAAPMAPAASADDVVAAV